MEKRNVREEQLKLKESRHRYDELYDCAPVGYIILDNKGCIQAINLTAAAQLGIERPQLIGKPFTSFVIKSDVRKFKTYLQQCRQAKNKVTTEVGLLVKGSESIYVQLISIAVQDSRHSVLGYRTIIMDITERKRIEEELLESEERYRATFEQAVDPIVLVDTETGAIVKFNKKAYENLGYMYEEFQKLNITDVEVIETAEEVKKHIKKIVKEGSDEFETKLKTKSGEIRDVLANSKVICYHGKILLQSNWHDITERKQAEEALHESEERFRKLSEASFEGIAFHDKGNILEVNKNFAEMFGYELNEVIGMHALDFTAQESRDLVLKNIVSGYEKPYEVVGLRKDGSTFQIEVRGKAISYQGRVVRVTAIRDITERKKAEKALEESVKRFKFLVDSINDGLGQVDDNQIVTYVNDNMCKMLGYNKSELIGQHSINFLGETKKERFQNLLDLRKKGIEQSYELELKRKDGTKISVLVSPKALFDADDKYKGTFAVCTDITEHKRAEEKIKAALKEKEMLLKEIHHRVKNNLQIINSLLDLQSEYIKDKKVLELFKRSQSRLKSIALIHDQLYQSKVLAKINFNEYIQNLTENLFQLNKIISDAIQLKLNVEDVLLSINTAIPCGLIINELVSNALKYAFPASRVGQILIEFRKVNDNKFTLIVKDNGVGLPKEMDFRSTESFGLQLVCILTEQLDGIIELDRKGGTTFKITFTEK
ncbi:MAG: PAS domain S-box protein [bacterium]